MIKFNSGFFDKLKREVVRILIFINNSFDSCIDNHSGANWAWAMSYINCSAINRNPHFCRLSNCILFCAHSNAHFKHCSAFNVKLVTQTNPAFFAVFNTSRSTIISRCYNSVVSSYHRSNLFVFANTRTPRTNKTSHVYKPFIPLLSDFRFHKRSFMCIFQIKHDKSGSNLIIKL